MKKSELKKIMKSIFVEVITEESDMFKEIFKEVISENIGSTNTTTVDENTSTSTQNTKNNEFIDRLKHKNPSMAKLLSDINENMDETKTSNSEKVSGQMVEHAQPKAPDMFENSALKGLKKKNFATILKKSKEFDKQRGRG